MSADEEGADRALARLEKERLARRRCQTGELVAALRTLHGLSQTQLGQKVRVSKRIVQEVEAGRRSIKLEEAPRWGAALKIKPERLESETDANISQLRTSVSDIRRAQEAKRAYLEAAREWEAARRQAQLLVADKGSLVYQAATRMWGEDAVTFLSEVPKVEWHNADGNPYLGPFAQPF